MDMVEPTNDMTDTEAKLVKLAKVWLKGPVRAKEEAFHALVNFGHPKALSMVREVVTHRNSRLQDYAIDYRKAFSEGMREEYKAIVDLNDGKWTIRCAAAMALRNIQSQSGKRALLARYKQEKHPIVRRDIACALGYWNEDKIIDFLRTALGRETHVSGRIGCLEGLVRCGERSYVHDYAGLLQHDDPLVRRQVVNSMANNTFHPQDIEYVVSCLTDLFDRENQAAARDGVVLALERISQAQLAA